MTERTSAGRYAGWAVVAGLLWVLSGCGDGGPLGNAGTAAPASAAPEPGPPPLGMALAAALAPDHGTGVYRELATYIGHRLGREVELVEGLSYSAIDAMLAQDILQFGFVCGLPYVESGATTGVAQVLVAAPVPLGDRYDDRPIYFSEVIVPRSSEAESLSDLRHARLIYSDRRSNSGFLMPLAELAGQGLAEEVVRRSRRVGSHEEAIRRVATGEAAAAAVASTVLDYERLHNPELDARVRVLATLGPAAAPPLVASPGVAPEVVGALRDIMLDMHRDAEGRAILERARIARFERVEDTAYDTIRAMRDQLRVAVQDGAGA